MENWRNLNRHFKSISHHLRHPVNTNQLNCTVLQGEGILTLLGFLQKRNMKTHLKTHFRKMKRETLLFIQLQREGVQTCSSILLGYHGRTPLHLASANKMLTTTLPPTMHQCGATYKQFNWRNLNRHFKSISHHLRHPVNTNQLNCTVLQGEGILTLLGFLQKRNMKTHLKTHFRKMKRETLLFIQLQREGVQTCSSILLGYHGRTPLHLASANKMLTTTLPPTMHQCGATYKQFNFLLRS